MAVTLASEHTNDALPRRHVISWTSDGSGDATGTVGPIYGVMLRVTTNPAAGGDAPSDNYDVTITDADGIDVLAGLGANRDQTNSETFIPLLNGSDGTNTTPLPFAIAGLLTVTVAAAGATKSGTISLYVR